MDKNERNEHFKAYAELLLEDLKECGAIPKFLNAYYAEQARTIIAQHAYDLAIHVVNNTSESSASAIEVEFITAEDVVHSMPDLTSWPNPQ